MNKEGYDNLETTLKLLDIHKKIVIWGASGKSDNILVTPRSVLSGLS